MHQNPSYHNQKAMSPSFSVEIDYEEESETEIFSFDDEDLIPPNIKAKSDKEDNDNAADGFESVEVTGITAAEFLAALDRLPTPPSFKKQSNAPAFRFPRIIHSFEHQKLNTAVPGTEDAKQHSPASSASSSSWETIPMSTDTLEFTAYARALDTQSKPPSARTNIEAQESPANSADSLSWDSEFGLLSHISDDSVWDSFHSTHSNHSRSCPKHEDKLPESSHGIVNNATNVNADADGHSHIDSENESRCSHTSCNHETSIACSDCCTCAAGFWNWSRAEAEATRGLGVVIDSDQGSDVGSKEMMESMSGEEETDDCSVPTSLLGDSCSSLSSSEAEDDVVGGEAEETADTVGQGHAETRGPDELTLAASAVAVLYTMAWLMEQRQEFLRAHI